MVFHDQPLLESTSAVATAIWHVYLVDPSDNQNLDWSKRTLRRLLEQCQHAGTGLELCEGVELFRTQAEHRPSWADLAIGFQPLCATELERYAGCSWGYRIAAPTANMAKYLPWLHGECERRGVAFVEERVERLQDLLDRYRLVVNCAGLGARALVDDDELYPVRGQYLVLRARDSSPTAYVGDDDNPGGMAYVIPRDGELLVGGTEEPNEWGMEFIADRDEMLRRANEFYEEDLSELEEIRRVVGLRPCRRSKQVRFGPDRHHLNLIHNYGHGGSGFSLAWGCAEDVAELAAGSP